jgi:azurin
LIYIKARSFPFFYFRRMRKTSVAVIALGCGALLQFITSCAKAPDAPPKEVTILADDKMRFDVTAFDAKPGQKISITLKNVGTTPKFSMGHNFVMLDRTINTGNVQSAFLDKASMEASHDYVPPGAKEVLAHTKLLGPGETDTVTFTPLTFRATTSISARSPAITLRVRRVS